jgi:outer membrane protein assembly factor BamB
MRRTAISRLELLAVAVAGAAALVGCSDWTAFRGDSQRTAYKDDAAAFSDPAKVASMHQSWLFQPPNRQAFRASPIVLFSKVFIGNGNGYLYALDAQTGAQKWQYPAVGAPALQWGFPNCGNRSGYGIASSATTGWHGIDPVVIFGAPDPSIGMGDGRLFMLKANDGSEVWKSPSLAQVTGTTAGAGNEKHEHLGYSSPLIEGSRIYVGVSDTCDNPIQLGRVMAVDFSSGNVSAGFSFVNGPRPASTWPPGGDVWGSVAADGGKLYVTTGNANDPGIGQPEPSPNYALSLLQLDPASGAPQWQHQPVPYSMDGDPDWSATPTVIHASCGNVVVGTLKDGWTWGLNADAGAGGHPTVRWVFPADDPNWINGFHPGDGTTHGDTDYIRPGAVWGDIYVVMDGGEDTVNSIYTGFSHLHALDVCADDAHRIRWIASSPDGSSFGFPVITKGLVYVGTGSGHLLVLADPTIVPPATFICTKVTVPNALCAANGFRIVPQPAVLVDKQLDGAVLTEPVLAEKNLYVATDGGSLYMFDP